MIGLILCDTLLAPFPVTPNGIYLLFIQKLVNLNKSWVFTGITCVALGVAKQQLRIVVLETGN